MSIRVTNTPVSLPPPRPLSPDATPSSRFGERLALLRETRTATPPTPSAAPTPTPAPAPRSIPAPTPLAPLTEAGRQLLSRVARGERYVENVVRQAVGGRAFTPADLLVMQAQVYRYTQELELVSKLVERGTGTVKTILQQNG
jgi:hypothetical protein